MRKRERENPCAVCGHYHKYEEGEVCGICGHRLPVISDKPEVLISAFPSEILPDFLYLGGYDNASRSELLKTQGICRILNTVPFCQNLYKNSFMYHCLKDEKALQFDDAIQFLEICEMDKARVLVHCMSGKNRSPAIVIAFLMKSKGWRLTRSYQWVKERRPAVDLTPGIYQQLQDYERKIFGSNSQLPDSERKIFGSNSQLPDSGFCFPKLDESASVSVFSSVDSTSIFDRPALSTAPYQFASGGNQIVKSITEQHSENSSDITMDGS